MTDAIEKKVIVMLWGRTQEILRLILMTAFY